MMMPMPVPATFDSIKGVGADININVLSHLPEILMACLGRVLHSVILPAQSGTANQALQLEAFQIHVVLHATQLIRDTLCHLHRVCVVQRQHMHVRSFRCGGAVERQHDRVIMDACIHQEGAPPRRACCARAGTICPRQKMVIFARLYIYCAQLNPVVRRQYSELYGTTP